MCSAFLRVESLETQRLVSNAVLLSTRELVPEKVNIVAALLSLGGHHQKYSTQVLDLTVKNNDIWEREKTKNRRLSTIGCVLLPSLAKFSADSVLPLWKGILQLSSVDITHVTRDPKGCRALETLMVDSTISSRQRRYVLQCFEGRYGILALKISGAIMIEKCFASMNLDDRSKVAEELVLHEQEITSRSWGLHLFETLKLESFKSRPDAFRQV